MMWKNRILKATTIFSPRHLSKAVKRFQRVLTIETFTNTIDKPKQFKTFTIILINMF